MSTLRSLWRGEYPLSDAFWTWAVLGGILVNLVTTLLFVLMLMFERSWAALFFGYLVPLPYNVIAAVGVWRSADRYEGPAIHAILARAATMIIMAVLSVT